MISHKKSSKVIWKIVLGIAVKNKKQGQVIYIYIWWLFHTFQIKYHRILGIYLQYTECTVWTEVMCIF